MGISWERGEAELALGVAPRMAQLPIDPAFPLWLPSSGKGNRNPVQFPLLWAMLPTHARSLQNPLSTSSRDLETKWIDTSPGTNSRPGFPFSFFLGAGQSCPIFLWKLQD